MELNVVEIKIFIAFLPHNSRNIYSHAVDFFPFSAYKLENKVSEVKTNSHRRINILENSH